MTDATAPPAAASAPAPRRATLLRRHGRRLAALAAWVAAIAGYQAWALSQGLGPVEGAERLLDVLASPVAGPVLYVVAYLLRPITLFPATVLTVIGGMAFGAAGGIVLSVIGANGSAAVAYLVARYVGGDLLSSPEASSLAARWAARMRVRSFETVFLMRVLFLPYDLVSYLAGLLRLRLGPFLLATALGSLPGTVAFVLFGASLESFDGGLPAVNPWVLAASLSLFAVSLLIARHMRARQREAVS